MLNQIEEIKIKAREELARINNAADLESWRVRYLGKKSQLTRILRGLADLTIEERKAVGSASNVLKQVLEGDLKIKEQQLRNSLISEAADREALDVTLPGRRPPVGHLHPITQTLQEISDIFVSMGFQVMDGPEVELEYYNFDALNIPEGHPSRDKMSSSWIDYTDENGKKPMLLRTHNTCVSARALASMKPPIRVISPGKVYRYEASDATHTSMFHQVDGVAVDRNITMADLKGTLYEFARRFFGENRKVRFRCDFFPFVEPGVEIAVECAVCKGRGCRLCGNSGYIEIGGAGMTHPEVLRRAGLDPEVYQSFAFGMGVERQPMVRYGIEDIRLFYNSDLRFLQQF
ncbi:MAG: phenylalanine--tRNA ligase subunit alpha [Dehalococcoidales bacterium]|nr:phenylalanine--tRNA ligase subunit alpha [Dehalococcoidales bacterium]